jgi:hypothetical protein
VIEEVRFEMTFDPEFTRLENIEKISPGLRADAVISNPSILGTRIRFTLNAPGGLSDTGALIAVKLEAVATGPECRDVQLDWDISLPYDMIGNVSGPVCINPSCRLPDGLHAAEMPRMTVTPVPTPDLLTVRITSPSSIFVSIRLLDAQGRQMNVMSDGLLQAGVSTRQFSVAELPSGYYYLLLHCAFGENITPVIVRK